jgi:hypothetical protein
MFTVPAGNCTVGTGGGGAVSEKASLGTMPVVAVTGTRGSGIRLVGKALRSIAGDGVGLTAGDGRGVTSMFAGVAGLVIAKGMGVACCARATLGTLMIKNPTISVSTLLFSLATVFDLIHTFDMPVIHTLYRRSD